MNSSNTQSVLIEQIGSFTWNPLSYSQFSFPWGMSQTDLADVQGLRDWQTETLTDITLHLSNPETRYMPLQIAVSSGHGIGKSALIGIVTKWALDTCVDTRIVITANTEGQLKNKTLPEVSKWHRLAITRDWFKIEKTSIHAHGKSELTWRLDFVPWSIHNTEAFQGLHNKGKRIVIVFDEGSSIDDKIWQVTEGALTDADTEIIWLVFGNPTRNMGRFRECFRKHSKEWITKKIDSRSVPGTNLELFKKWEEREGDDSDFFRVRVRGEFPSQSDRQFYSTELIETAQKKVLRQEQYKFAPVIITCDPSWTGSDDLVIAKRQGLDFVILETIKQNDNDIKIANKLARYEDEYQADAGFIDGGYGTGIYSALKTMHRHKWQLVWFAEKSNRQDCVNKRAEMLVMIREWLRDGGSIPEKDGELYEELLAVETIATLDGKYKFPPKEDFKEIIDRSPNKLDALGMSFAQPVQAKIDPMDIDQVHRLHTRRTRTDNYNPMDNVDNE